MLSVRSGRLHEMVAADPRLEALAFRVRVPNAVGRLDIEETARQHEIELRTADLRGSAEAVTVDGLVILNDSFPTEGRRRFVFAHELAHLLIARGSMPWVRRQREEQWADWFAHECVMPSRWLREGCWHQLRLFDDPAERQTLAMHLASHSRTPAVLRVDGNVICGSCGDRSFGTGCACEPFRESPDARWRLPELSWTHEVNLDQLQLFATDDLFAALWRELVVDPSGNAESLIGCSD